MGEEAKQQKQPQAEAKPEEKTEEKKEEKAEEKKVEEKKEKEEPKPPSPFVLFVDLHCVGCAKKIERSIMKIKGVEGVVIDMAQNQVTIKGIVEPQAVCAKIMKKTKRMAKVLSPLPAAEGEPIPEVVTSQVSGVTTVELNVNMHCEACAEQLKKKILKMRGVQTVTTELSTSKVIVTGTMDGNKLVDYVYRRTKKQAKIVPQPEPEPEKKEDEKAAEGEAKPEENGDKKEEGKQPEETKNEGGGENQENKGEGNIEGPPNEGVEIVGTPVDDLEHMKRMMYNYYQPMYLIERIPPPQIFSDENPNACCIT